MQQQLQEQFRSQKSQQSTPPNTATNKRTRANEVQSMIVEHALQPVASEESNSPVVSEGINDDDIETSENNENEEANPLSIDEEDELNDNIEEMRKNFKEINKFATEFLQHGCKVLSDSKLTKMTEETFAQPNFNNIDKNGSCLDTFLKFVPIDIWVDIQAIHNECTATNSRANNPKMPSLLALLQCFAITVLMENTKTSEDDTKNLDNHFKKLKKDLTADGIDVNISENLLTSFANNLVATPGTSCIRSLKFICRAAAEIGGRLQRSQFRERFTRRREPHRI